MKKIIDKNFIITTGIISTLLFIIIYITYPIIFLMNIPKEEVSKYPQIYDAMLDIFVILVKLGSIFTFIYFLFIRKTKNDNYKFMNIMLLLSYILATIYLLSDNNYEWYMIIVPIIIIAMILELIIKQKLLIKELCIVGIIIEIIVLGYLIFPIKYINIAIIWQILRLIFKSISTICLISFLYITNK